jgi:hypothetical protein
VSRYRYRRLGTHYMPPGHVRQTRCGAELPSAVDHLPGVSGHDGAAAPGGSMSEAAMKAQRRRIERLEAALRSIVASEYAKTMEPSRDTQTIMRCVKLAREALWETPRDQMKVGSDHPCSGCSLLREMYGPHHCIHWANVDQGDPSGCSEWREVRLKKLLVRVKLAGGQMAWFGCQAENDEDAREQARNEKAVEHVYWVIPIEDFELWREKVTS